MPVEHAKSLRATTKKENEDYNRFVCIVPRLSTTTPTISPLQRYPRVHSYSYNGEVRRSQVDVGEESNRKERCREQ